jgi:cobalt/nickel transport system permease protein
MSLLSELFSDLFARQDNLLTRVDPRTKLVVAMSLLALVVLASAPMVPLAVFAVCVGAAVAVGVPTGFIMLRMTGPLVIAAVLLVLQATLTGHTPVWSLRISELSVTFTAEGWHIGLLMASRVLGGTGVLLLLSAVTPAHRIFSALRAMGVSKGWVEIAMLMYRYIFVLMDLTADVASAQRLRLGYSNVRRSVTSAGVVAGVVVLRAVDQAVRTNEAMCVRGYRGEIPQNAMPPLERRDWWIMSDAVLAVVVVHIITGDIFP